MGNWVVTISGTGCHHNHERAQECGDIDWLVKEFIKSLKEAGQNVTHAQLVSGSDDPEVNKDIK